MISADELFDDHYGYEGLQSSLMVTRVFPGSLIAKLSGGVVNKLYSSLPAYDLEGNVLANQRVDTRSYLNLQIEKNFENLGFSSKIGAEIIYNKSNDPFYNYHNTAFTFELNIPF